MIYFQAPFVKISWDEAIKAVCLEWQGQTYGENLKKGLNTGLKLLAEKKAEKWLADTEKLGVFGKADEEWINTDWYPRILNSGLKHMAIIIPKNALARIAVNSQMSKVPGTMLEMAYFDNQETARAWLRSC